LTAILGDNLDHCSVATFQGGLHMAVTNDEEVLVSALLRLSGRILGVVLGVLFALLIFLATNWLVIKGGPVVGPNLSLLGQYFIGYTITFAGSLIGSLYGFVVGYVSGVLIAWVYNQVALWRRGTGSHGSI
jgi:hypothetical protein